MIRAFFLACGAFITLCGGLLLLVDQIVLTDEAGGWLRATAGPLVDAETTDTGTSAGKTRWRLVSLARHAHETDATKEASGDPSDIVGRNVVDPPDWGAFGLLSIGGVTLLYTFALPGRRDDGDDEEDDSAPFHRHR